MKTADKRYKFINSETGYIIYYWSIKSDLEQNEVRDELERVKALVAIKNKIFMGTIYWEEIKEDLEDLQRPA